MQGPAMRSELAALSQPNAGEDACIQERSVEPEHDPMDRRGDDDTDALGLWLMLLA